MATRTNASLPPTMLLLDSKNASQIRENGSTAYFTLPEGIDTLTQSEIQSANVQLLQFQCTNSIYNISDALKNNTLEVYVARYTDYTLTTTTQDTIKYILPDGHYSTDSLVNKLNQLIATNSKSYSTVVNYTPTFTADSPNITPYTNLSPCYYPLSFGAQMLSQPFYPSTPNAGYFSTSASPAVSYNNDTGLISFNLPHDYANAGILTDITQGSSYMTVNNNIGNSKTSSFIVGNTATISGFIDGNVLFSSNYTLTSGSSIEGGTDSGVIKTYITTSSTALQSPYGYSLYYLDKAQSLQGTSTSINGYFLGGNFYSTNTSLSLYSYLSNTSSVMTNIGYSGVFIKSLGSTVTYSTTTTATIFLGKTSATTYITNSNNPNILVGMTVSGTGVTPGTTVVAYSANTLSLSSPQTIATDVKLTFTTVSTLQKYVTSNNDLPATSLITDLQVITGYIIGTQLFLNTQKNFEFTSLIQNASFSLPSGLSVTATQGTFTSGKYIFPLNTTCNGYSETALGSSTSPITFYILPNNLGTYNSTITNTLFNIKSGSISNLNPDGGLDSANKSAYTNDLNQFFKYIYAGFYIVSSNGNSGLLKTIGFPITQTYLIPNSTYSGFGIKLRPVFTVGSSSVTAQHTLKSYTEGATVITQSNILGDTPTNPSTGFIRAGGPPLVNITVNYYPDPDWVDVVTDAYKVLTITSNPTTTSYNSFSNYILASSLYNYNSLYSFQPNNIIDLSYPRCVYVSISGMSTNNRSSTPQSSYGSIFACVPIDQNFGKEVIYEPKQKFYNIVPNFQLQNIQIRTIDEFGNAIQWNNGSWKINIGIVWSIDLGSAGLEDVTRGRTYRPMLYNSNYDPLQTQEENQHLPQKRRR